MGLYDTIEIGFDVSNWIPSFPISDKDIKNTLFQSKDFLCCLDHYYIDINGHIWDVEGDLPIGDGSEVKMYSVSSFYRLHNGSLLTIPYSGHANLYSSNDDYSWIEFIAVFHRSKLESFHLLNLVERIQNG